MNYDYIMLTWSVNRKRAPFDETRMILGRGYKNLTKIAKLDFLKDSIWELEQEYEKTINQPAEETNENL